MSISQLVEHFDQIIETPGAIPRLRRFIFDLAIRGKLADQNNQDESSEELLKLVTSLREKNPKLIKKKAPSKSKDNNANILLPTGWSWVKLGALCTKTGSGSTPAGGKSVYPHTGIPFLRSQNIYNHGLELDGLVYITQSTHERMSSTAVKAGDLLLNITGGSIGRCAIVPDDFIEGNINQHIAIIRLALLESKRFVHAVICSDYFQQQILIHQTGSGRQGLPKNRMDEILVPIAPLAEQHRIVTKIDQLMFLCDQLEAAQKDRNKIQDELIKTSQNHLDQSLEVFDPVKQREIIAIYLHNMSRMTARQEHITSLQRTLLKLAIRGRLYMQDTNIEDDKVKGNLLHSKRKNELFEGRMAINIPLKDWVLSRFGEVFSLKYGQSLPAGMRSNSGEYSVYGSNGIVGSHNESMVKSPCIVIGRKGSAGALNLNLTSSCWVTDVAYYCIPPDGIDLEFAFNLFKTLDLESLGKGIKPGLNRTEVYDLYVSIPSLNEQKKIVLVIDKIVTLCVQLKVQISTVHSECLRLLETSIDRLLGIQKFNSIPAFKKQKTSLALENELPIEKAPLFMISDPAKTVAQLIECIDDLEGECAPERLLRQCGLGEDIENFYDLLRLARDAGKLFVKLGPTEKIRRHVDAH
ncbi:restriction endonuclease subunit S [Undibacterium sp. Di26W]|uniref:restriction endonuclease subunit S n=1 Tax=Undibacterium sp. Di26W TaxID=3413035 RepID=UPI003BF0DFD1